ncbi:MAG: hypothetical protein ABSG59_09960 [Verrucomicrobiota bacterium]|jgi:hypothetical protein
MPAVDRHSGGVRVSQCGKNKEPAENYLQVNLHKSSIRQTSFYPGRQQKATWVRQLRDWFPAIAATGGFEWLVVMSVWLFGKEKGGFLETEGLELFASN